MSSIYQVVQVKDGQKLNRFVDFAQACVLWVKYPDGRRVEKMEPGMDSVLWTVTPEECCRILRKWLGENKHLRNVEREDMTQFIDEACRSLAYMRRRNP